MSTHSDKEVISAAARWVVRRNAGLSVTEAEELRQWLDGDARHRTAFEHYARAWSAFEGPEREDAQSAMIRRIGTRVRQRRARRVGGMFAAACVIAVLAFAVLRPWPSVDRLRPAGALPAGTVVIHPERLVLEDGSVVELRQGSAIDVRYDDATRRVILSGGEAHFQVAKGQDRPFVVVADGMEVRAVGTAFVVQRGAAQVEVWVTEGRVAVEKATPAAPPGPEDATTMAGATTPSAVPAAPPVPPEPVPVAMLGAHERIVVRTAPEAVVPVVTPVTSAEINERLTWRIPRVEFSATPLAEAIALINSFSHLPDGSANARLVLASELSGIASEPVSGFFRVDNIEAFVHLLEMNLGIEGERRGNEIILRKARR
ncbi:FecR domain-containing protein [Termitidicoccus mucosus]|uniref:FecR protein domain-containing protein n=1 Tax=Termitidicoccus mucosus TaxID=1184151 RepID=A0A178IK90_9BACT|nr:hypothetical protein AW736_12050 [Opitutaceae bacterium TSB47]